MRWWRARTDWVRVGAPAPARATSDRSVMRHLRERPGDASQKAKLEPLGARRQPFSEHLKQHLLLSRDTSPKGRWRHWLNKDVL